MYVKNCGNFILIKNHLSIYVMNTKIRAPFFFFFFVKIKQFFYTEYK